jgi:nitroimidazol reductase NimA-like FMN-containing flavoprotein (pyridoxamine 5'-phosphate oxidase superfamily)
MTMSPSLAMSPAEREAFLRDLHVAIISIAENGRGPLTVPIWYSCEPTGEVQVITERTSRKGTLLERHRRFSLCVQTEAPPYKYVSVEGPVTAIEPVDVERHLRPLARRYLGIEGGDRYVEATGGQATRADTVAVRMRPERWLSVDYGKTPLLR